MVLHGACSSADYLNLLRMPFSLLLELTSPSRSFSRWLSFHLAPMILRSHFAYVSISLCFAHATPPSMTLRMHLSSRPYNFTRCFSHRIFRLLFTSGPLVTYVLLLPQSFSHHIYVSPMFCIVLICFTSHSALCFFTRYGDFPRDVVSCHETWLNAF